MEILETWYERYKWSMEFSPRRDICLITLKTRQEIYPIRVYCGAIGVVRQVGENEFIYTTGDLVTDWKIYEMSRAFVHRVKLEDGVVIRQGMFLLKDEYKKLYTKWGRTHYNKLLRKNRFMEAEPRFSACEMLDKYEYDANKYELYSSRRYLILKERESDEIFLHYYDDEKCLGITQVGNALLMICQDKQGHIIRRVEIGNKSGSLHPDIVHAEPGFSSGLVGALRLYNTDCQIDKNRIYTTDGQYLISQDRMVKYPSNTVEMVTLMALGGDGKVMPLALTADIFAQKPREIGLFDPFAGRAMPETVEIPPGNLRDQFMVVEKSAI